MKLRRHIIDFSHGSCEFHSMPLSPSVSEASSTVVEMGMAERSMYDPNEVPESRTVENRHASDGRESNDHSQRLGRTGSPGVNLV